MEDQEKILTLWIFKYHTGRPETTVHTRTILELFYANDEIEARAIVNDLIEEVDEMVYEESLEPAPHGFIIQYTRIPGKISSTSLEPSAY